MDTNQPSQGETQSCVQSREFEFQMCKTSLEKDAITLSPADELFYKGKLLPLHLPPRLQMVQNLLQNSISPASEEEEEEKQESLTNSNSPLESCSVSPTDSCRVSCELNPDEHFFQWSTGVSGLNGGVCVSKKPWSKKIRLIKQCVLSQKLRSSRDYMKSFFTRPEAISDKHIKNVLNSEMDDQISFTCHRLSFSGAIKRHSTSNKNSSISTTTTTASSSSTASSNCSCSSSSFSMKSTNGFYEIDFLKKGVKANSEDEYSIEGAIAHCKKSQQKQDFPEEKRHQSEVENCLLSPSRSEISSQ